MPVENDFIPFAVGGSANVLTQAAYAALTSLTQNGFQSGIAPSVQLNKVWRQSSIMAAVIASFIVAQTGQTAIDDGTTATLLANFTNAVNAASKTKVVLTDTGTANAYAAANPVPLTVLPTATGFTQTVKITHANTGSSTYAPDGLATAPIYGLGGSLLQGSEMPTNGVATFVSFVDPLLNSGNLCWVLYECVGGSQQIAPATQPLHAVQFGQVLATPQGQLYYNAGNLAFAPYRGNKVFIPGQGIATIPGGGIGYAPTGLTTNTLYYVYVTLVSGSLGFVLSTTGHSTDPTGVEVQTSNNSLVLVGMAYALSATSIESTVRSWANDPGYAAKAGLASNSSTSSTTLTNVNTGLILPFLLWAAELPVASFNATCSVGTANNGINSAISVDNGAPTDPISGQTPATTNNVSIAITQTLIGLAEGHHTINMFGSVGGSSGVWLGGASGAVRTSTGISISARK